MPLENRLLSAALGLVSFASVCAGPGPSTELEQLFYDRWVAGYCGLGGDEMQLAFERALADLRERRSPSDEALRGAENHALTLVEREWSNRGLGGFRVWCRTEGVAAAARIRRFAP